VLVVGHDVVLLEVKRAAGDVSQPLEPFGPPPQNLNVDGPIDEVAELLERTPDRHVDEDALVVE